jgi:hypothetical protein
MINIPIGVTIGIYRYAVGDIPDNAVLVSEQKIIEKTLTVYDIDYFAPGANITQSVNPNFIKKISIVDDSAGAGSWNYILSIGKIIDVPAASMGDYAFETQIDNTFYVKETEYEDGLA